jgi:leucine efflux protein
MSGFAHGLMHLPAFVAAAGAVIVVPGPATMLVATRAAASRRSAITTTAGIVAGDVVAITLAGTGLAAVLAQAPGLMHVLRAAGGAWVAWLGIKLLRTNPRSSGPDAPTVTQPSNAFVQALGMTLANPKPMMFFAAFFPLFVQPDAGAPLFAFWRLGALFEAINLVWFAGIVLLARAVAGRRAVGGVALNRLGGLALLGCAALVLMA